MSSRDRTDPPLERIREVLRARREELLRLPGCTGVGIGFRKVGGTSTGRLALVVFVREKRSGVPPGERIPADLDGVPTDVQEAAFEIVRSATDPRERFDPLIGGISIAALATPGSIGTVGCFFHTPGNPAMNVAEGDYLLTCQHVLAAAHPDRAPEVIQPGTAEDPPPPEFRCGVYVAGIDDRAHDCAIVRVDRGYKNEVPDYPGSFGNRDILGIGEPEVGQLVYKYGAGSKFTTGVVDAVDVHTRDFDGVIRIARPGNYWTKPGDSGAVAITQEGDLAIGLCFGPDSADRTVGLAFPIAVQMNAFSATGGIRLSHPRQ